MDHWLVCFSAKVPAARRRAIIRAAGAAETPDGEPVPLGPEVAVQVDADASAVASLRGHADVRGVYPNSELRAY